MESSVDVLLHPVRMRIIQHLINQQLTSQQLMERLPDIPQASLYRNIKKLSDAGILHIVNEIPIRGTVEKVYSIHNPNTSLSGTVDISRMSKDDQMGVFIKFMANLMGEYDRYLNQENIDFRADGVTFRQTSLYLNDHEFEEFIVDLRDVYSKFSQNKLQEGRRRRTLATIIIPGEKEGEK
ncbi:helix-turn-helix domain-containing protein [Neobacillus dielmonensis]|uniref:helix-turn-helix domain-containing protein n=1 Tax=Neobacillus dielmonensis TaxID=1347369 RepID=UPI0005A9B95B|nr:helix-turn-helix domain-containing protein [Neobacillus dielmonensis]